jgi:hypothetical protein
MSRTVREITAELAATGLTPDQMALVIELSIAAKTDASERSKHAEAQARYWARKKSELIISDQNDHTDQAGSPPHDIKNSSPPTPSSKPKRVSRSVAIDVPEEIPQSAVNFAVSHGWDTAKTQSEWLRFRNWSFNKGRKHRRLDSAWQNWVTSPYQTNGSENGQQSSGNRTPQGSGSTGQDATLAGLGHIAARIRQRGDAERREREVADGNDAPRGNVARLF